MLIPADVEQAVIDELSDLVIGTSLPQTLPAKFLRVVAVGGFQRDLVSDSFTVTLESFASRETTARMNLAMAVGRLQDSANIFGAVGNEVCYQFDLVSTLSNFPNPDVPNHKRYIVTMTVVLRRHSITL